MPEVLANINILLICFCQEEITIITAEDNRNVYRSQITLQTYASS